MEGRAVTRQISLQGSLGRRTYALCVVLPYRATLTPKGGRVGGTLKGNSRFQSVICSLPNLDWNKLQTPSSQHGHRVLVILFALYELC